MNPDLLKLGLRKEEALKMPNSSNEKPTVGILAYGSLISDPRAEIEKHRTDTIRDVITPFHIEFARQSRGRGGAPTLVPVTNGGVHVTGQVFVMDLPEAEAADVLYRREIDDVGGHKTYKRPATVTKNSVLVERLTNFAGLNVVLYTKIAATIEPLTTEKLAELAIASVSKADPTRDGISYLMAAKENGIVTSLSPAYVAEILRKIGCETLEKALAELKD
ncbi:hypothetical protein [Roseibium sp.]|uniref:hypothetical protein n=1 Tax=Roseibium sp. TaxID=1936156 RepID=UPI003B52D86D